MPPYSTDPPSLGDSVCPAYPNQELAKVDIQKAIKIYNKKRPHKSVNMMVPMETPTVTGTISSPK